MLNLIKKLKKRELVIMFFSLLFIIMQVQLDLKAPEYMNEITQIIEKAKIDIEDSSGKNDIWKNGFKMLGCTLLSILCSVVTSYCMVNISSNYSARLRKNIYDKIQSFSNAEINRFHTASLITRSTNDVEEIQGLITTGLQLIVKAPLIAILAVRKISSNHWEWTSAIAASIIFMMLIGIIMLKFIVSGFQRLQVVKDDLNGITRENLNGQRVIRAYNSEEIHNKKFSVVSDEYAGINLYIGRIGLFLNPFMMFIMNIISVFIYWVGAALINKEDVPGAIVLFGDMIVFMSYGMQIVMAFVMISLLFVVLPRFLISAKRINEILLTNPTINYGTERDDGSEKKVLEFKNISFRYPNGHENVLSDISFKVRSGETIAFIGPTGCGKSSIVELLTRAYDYTSGSITINGKEINKYSKESLFSMIGYVPQKSLLLSGDIRKNLRIANENINENDMLHVLEIAQCKDFIDFDGEGLDKHVAQNGSNLSGGQKQRLSIARALAKRADIYIFDDSFSALDFKTDREVRSKIKSELSESIMIIVSQRIGTIMDADQIMVIDNGKILGHGTHYELMMSCSFYKEIVDSQLREEDNVNE